MEEAVRLVKEEDMSVAKAAMVVNDIKKNPVPRMTLNDRINRQDPTKEPLVGRPQELSKAAEEAIVKCLVWCAEFQYPQSKRDLQKLVQSYCIENQVEVRWKDSKPGKDWIRNFQKRWSHMVKVRKPRNIKRSRAKVSPEAIRSFFERLSPNLENIPPTHIFNYDESPLKDDPGTYLPTYS